MNAKISETFHDENGNEVTVQFPAKYIVCESCSGFGSVLNDSMRFTDYTEQELQEKFSDEDRLQYLTRGGKYDITCPYCKGLRVKLTFDKELFTELDHEWYYIFCKHKVALAKAKQMENFELRNGA